MEVKQGQNLKKINIILIQLKAKIIKRLPQKNLHRQLNETTIDLVSQDFI